MDTGVTIYYMPKDGEAWASYIRDKLVSKPYEINCALLEVVSNEKDLKLPQSNVNVFFLTPDFLEYSNWELLLNLDRHTTVIVLTGVLREDLVSAEAHIKCDILAEFIICDLRQNEESVRELLISIISVYETVETSETPVPNSENDYSLLPKPRQVNAVHNVLFKDDMVYVLLDRPADGILTFKIAGYEEIHCRTTQCAVYSFPFKGSTNSTIAVFQEQHKLGECVINAHHDKTSDTCATSRDHIEIKKCVLKSFNDGSTQTDTLHERIADSSKDEVPESCPPPPCANKDRHYVNVTQTSVDVNLSLKPPKPSLNREAKLAKFRELFENQIDPIELLCDYLQIDTNFEQLDKKMASMIECSDALKHRSGTDWQEENTQAIWPTLVHFGAQYNLISFCDSLLSNPLMHQACVQANKDGHLPHNLARQHGHTHLAEMLEHFAKFVRAKNEGRHDSGFLSGNVRTPFALHHAGTQTKMIMMDTSAPPDGDSDSIDNDDDDDYVNVQDVNDSSMSSTPPFTDLLSLSSSLVYDMDQMRAEALRRSHSLTKSKNEILTGQDTAEKHKNDIEVKDAKLKKKGIFHGLFKGKKTHSKSEPVFAQTSPTSTVYRPNKGGRSYTQESDQNSAYSSASSSTASTYSTESYSNKDGDDLEVNKRNSGKKKNKNKFILKNAKNRQSIRIQHAFDDKNLLAPRIPQRKDVSVESR